MRRSLNVFAAITVFAALALYTVMLPGCAGKNLQNRPPDVAAAQISTDVLKAATLLQNEVNRLTAARVMPVPIGQAITDANKVVSAKAGQLSTALKAYHAATSPSTRASTAAEIQALITGLSEPLAAILGLTLPAGAVQSVTRLIGGVMQAVGAIQLEIAKGLSGALERPAPVLA